ncbi:hypothetical protein AYO21_12090 [Fonsecaea monophora]|uniref:Uncharacterized protein n=1 Tax=Fonsecaea monophora TaxID=254056 RepID=A0A177EQB1_9EURO|nr:hypothetical protein AYO21_12090 [Fonsecaea monophora]OAG33816.1 hypothetical protein AYO21_12090 [Fonsecaea monophora]
MLELLLLGGCDINAWVRDDWTPPLADASFDPELVGWLVEHGADPNAQCRYDITALSIAAGSASREVIELARRGDDFVELLLSKGGSPNALMFHDHPVSFCQFECLGLGTSLHEAVLHRHDRLVRLLLNHGANPQIRDSLGGLPQVKRLLFSTAL